MHGSSRATSPLAWLLVAQILMPTHPAGASTDSSTLPTGRSLAPSGAAANGAAPATDPFSGAAAHEIAIEVPPGTGGMTPQLSLRYASQARGDSWVGSGWSLGFPAITRSLESGTPRYDDATDVFELAGQELIAESANPALPRRYHTLRESFLRIVHEANGSWTVTRKDGVAMRFGVTAQARIANGAGQVFQWLLEEQEDRHGNAFAANYDRRDPGTAYLALVRYTLRRSAGGSLQSLDGTTAKDRRIEFALAQRSDAAESRRAGFLSRIAHRLDSIDVKVGTTLVRRYDLRYTQSADSFRSLLHSVALYGSDATSVSPTAPFVTSFAYHSNVAAGTTGWQAANWSWPAWLSLVDASRQDKGVRLVDVDGDARPDLVKALATLDDPDPKLATFSLTDSGVFLNLGDGFASVPSLFHPLPSFAGPNGQIPFSLAWQYGGVSRTTGLDILDVSGDGRADLVGGVRDLDAASGVRALYGMPAWYRGTATGFEAVAEVGDVLEDELWGINRSGIVDIFYSTVTRGTSSGNARFADLTGDGLPELVVRGVEHRYTAFGGPPPLASTSYNCVDQRLTNYYFENRGELRFERAPVTDSVGSGCQTSLKRVAADFQHCNLNDFLGCAYKIVYNEAQPVRFSDPSWGVFPWMWLVNWEFGAVDVDLNADGLADTLSASWDAYGYGAASTAWINSGARGYVETPAWALPSEIFLYELGPTHSNDKGLRFADVNGDGRVDVAGAQVGYQSATWLNDGDVNEASPTPWVMTAAWAIPAGLEFVDANGLDTGVRLVDIDADGMTDVIRSANGTNEVYLNRGAIPDLLTRVTIPSGARTDYAYEVSSQYDTYGADGLPDLPFAIPVVASVTLHSAPGRTQDVVSTTTYDYEGGRYDSDAREFRGFASVTETRPDGRRTIRAYHQSEALAGQLAGETIVDAGGFTWFEVAYAYADDATPPYITLPTRVERREYDAQTTPRRSLTTTLYDGYGNPIAITEWGEVSAAGVDLVPADTRTSEFSYFANPALHLVDRLKTRILRNGATPGVGTVARESRFAYDGDTSGEAPPSIGDLTRRIDMLGAPPLPNPTTTFGYDLYGNLTSVTDPRANAGEAGGTTTTEYDAYWHAFPTAVVNALGHRSEISYATAPGCAVAHSSGAGLVGQTRSPNDRVAGTSSDRCYDVFGRVVRESGPANLAAATWSYVDTPLAVATIESRTASATGARTTTTRYDGLGRAIQMEHSGPAGQTVVDTTIEYDPIGRVVSRTQPGFGAPGAATHHEYDPLDRVQRMTLPDSGRVHLRRYDRGLVEKIDPEGAVVRVQSDALGRVARVEEVAAAETWITRYEHDAGDQLTRITDHHGNQSSVDYDRLGRRIRIADPDIGHRTFAYDAGGNVITETVSGFETIEWAYDKLGRPLMKHGLSPRGLRAAKVIWRYDAALNGIGLLASRSDDDTHTQRVLEYDLLGRATREQSTLVLGNQRRSFDFQNAYDPLGQLATRRLPTGTELRFARDARGYLTSITSGAAVADAASIQWTAEGRVAAWTAPGGVVTTASYDAESRRLEASQVDGAGPGLLAAKTYQYDAADRMTAVTDTVGTNSMSFGYDARGRLERTTRLENGLWRLRTNAYDAIGNLVCREATGANCSGGTRLAYPFAPSDPQRRATSHRATSVDGAASIYDANGAVLLLGERSFRYDAFGKLIEVWDGATLSQSVRYDGGGRALELWSASAGERLFLPTDDFEWGETSHLAQIHVSLAGARIATHAMNFQPPIVPPASCVAAAPGLALHDASPLDLLGLFAPGFAALLLLGVRRRWRGVPAPRRVRLFVATGTGTAFLLVALVPVPFEQRGAARAQAGVPSSRFYHADHLGSVHLVTDANGAVVGGPTTFDPWGRTLGASSLATPFGFNGKRLVESIYDYGARWYDPQMGRFLQPDPVIADPYDPQGLSRYSYVRNDPVGRVDPTGMWSLSVNAWGGYYDEYGFTGVMLGGTWNNDGLFGLRGRVTIHGVQFAEYERIENSLTGVREALRVGAFQYFNQASQGFARASTGPGTQSQRDQLPYGPNPGVSQSGLAFILSQEGFRSTEYADTAGNPTIGFGHMIVRGEGFDEPLSVDDGMRLFQQDIANLVDPFLGSDTIKIALSQHQIDALGSFIFNVGGGAFSRSTLLRRVNAGKFEAAAREFRRWIYSGGRVTPGLETRRAEEAEIFRGR
jgi:RHS repeat-associated protein